MSSIQPPRSIVRMASDPQIAARKLGELIQSERMLDGRPIEELAPLAGLTVEEWVAIEGGQPPDSMIYLLLIGYTALRCSSMWMAYAACFYRGAMQNR